MDFIKQFCLSCSAFCTLYRDMNVPVHVFEDDMYISLKEVNRSNDNEPIINQEEHNYDGVDTQSKTPVKIREYIYGIGMLSKYNTDRIL